ncbi:MAG: TolC family protein [Deltaproteobacteria bacterium]|nr:TolC family protein [Deltaproteobacteria bacterium]
MQINFRVDNLIIFLKFFLFGFLWIFSSFADHPNEGSLPLNQLLHWAEENNLELQQAKKSLQSKESLLKSKYGALLPSFFLEAGPLFAKLEDEKRSDTFVYGKAEWNLYRGNFDSAEINKEKLLHQLEVKKFESLQSKLQGEVSRLYYELQFLLESISLKERALVMNAEQMKLALIKKNSGFTSMGDVIEFELRESTLKSDLVFLNQEIEVKSRQLNLLVARGDAALSVSESKTLRVKGHLFREEKLLKKELRLKDKLSALMVSKNIELVEANLQVAAAEEELRMAQSAYFPKIDLEAKYGKLYNEEKAYSQNNNYLLVLKFSIPLFSGLETQNLTRYKSLAKEEKEIDFKRRKLAVMAEFEDTYSLIEALSQRLDLEEKNLSRSEEYYQITLGEYKRGIKNSPDMVGASERLLSSRIRNLEFRRDLKLAETKIYELANTTPFN